MEIYIYSDESGVFDNVHNDYYVYGGLIFVSKDLKDTASRKYSGAEKNIAKAYKKGIELKACYINNKHKSRLYKSLRPFVKFGSVTYEKDINSSIFLDKRSKQRYLDFVYKIALKNAFVKMEHNNMIDFNSVTRLHVYVDEHTTATNGRYELREALLQEFKIGTFNWNWNKFYPPIFPNLVDVNLHFCNSSKVPLIRAADIIANHLYYLTNSNRSVGDKENLFIKVFP